MAPLANITKLKKPIHFKQSDNGLEIDVNERCLLDFYLEGIRFSDEFYLVPNLPDDVVIGQTTLLKWQIELDFETYKPIVKEKEARLSFTHSMVQFFKK